MAVKLILVWKINEIKSATIRKSMDWQGILKNLNFINNFINLFIKRFMEEKHRSVTHSSD